MPDLIRLLIDFGLVVLSWVVQLIIYPSFHHYSSNDLRKWHERYTGRITIIVFPLMSGQLLLSGLSVYKQMSVSDISVFILVMLTWLSTFLQAVPIHRQISDGTVDDRTFARLIRVNLPRTLIWTGIFIWHLILTLPKFDRL